MSDDLLSSLGKKLRPFRGWLLLLLAFLPGIWMANAVAKYAVDIACWDSWANGPLLQKWHDGTLGWHGLWAAQIQHRIVIPRLMIVAYAHLTGGDFRSEAWIAFGLSALSAVQVYLLMRRTIGASFWVYGLTFVANLLVFTPMLYQNWYWPSAFWMGIPVPCLLGALLFLHRPWALQWRVAAAVGCLVIATFSFGHGIFLWPVVITYLLLQPGLGNLKPRIIAAGVLGVMIAGLAAAYFHNFVNEAYHAYSLKPGDQAMIKNAGRDWAKVGRVFFQWQGALFARSPWEASPPIERAGSVGRVIFFVWLGLAALFTCTKRGRSLWREALPWLAISGYAVGIAFTVAVGRSDGGEFRAVTPRYIVISLFLWVGVLVLGFILARAWVASWKCDDCREKARRLGVGALAAAAVAQVPVWSYGMHLTHVWHLARLQGKSLVVFLDHFTPEPQRATFSQLDKSDFTNPNHREAWHYVTNSVRSLRALNLLKTPALERPDLNSPPLKKESKVLAPEKGLIDQAVVAADGRLRFAGRARFGQDRPADLIVIALPEKDGQHRIVGIGQPRSTPALRLYPLDYEFANVDASFIDERLHRWEAFLPPTQLPDGPQTLEFWAFNVENMTVTRLADTVKLDKAALAAQPPVIDRPAAAAKKDG